MKSIPALITTVYIVLSLTSCKQVKPPPPEASTLDTLLHPPLSVVHLPVQYHVSALEQMLNEKIKGTFVKKWLSINDSGDSIYLEVSRQREIKMRRENRTLHYSIPVKISGKFKAKVAGVNVKNSTPVEADINLHMATKLHIDKHWNLVPETQIEKIDWVKEPTIKVAFAKVNLRKPIEKVLHDKESQIITKADSAVQALMNTRKIVQKLWMDIQKPIRINKKGVQVWIKANAQDLSGHLEETDSDLISLNFELKTFTHIIYEGDSIPPSNPNLPDFKPNTVVNDSLNIYVHSLVRFDLINKILNDGMREKPLSAKGFTTTIKNIQVYGTPTGIAIEIKIRGDVDGLLYVKGTPAYDTLTNTFSIRDFDFDINSENSFLSSADWLLHTTVIDMINEKLQFDTEPLAGKLPDVIMKGIEKGKTGEKIDIHIDTLAVTPLTIITTKDNIQLIVRARGRATLELEQKLFEKKQKAKS